jgi:hypothetical protein
VAQQLIDERQQMQPLVFVASPDPDGERCAVGVNC